MILTRNDVIFVNCMRFSQWVQAHMDIVDMHATPFSHWKENQNKQWIQATKLSVKYCHFVSRLHGSIGDCKSKLC